jgi:uncharacterized protein YcnI
MNRTLAVPALATAALAATLAFAGAASAHVTVNPNTAAGGSYSKLTFRVPTESDSASTTKVAVFLPSAPRFASVSVKPHPGWTYRVTKAGDSVSRIVWQAASADSRIKPGEFDEFDISLGPLPDSGDLVFKALQYYSDGSVVRWIEPATDGGEEPEHPAPTLTIMPAASGDSSSAPVTTAPASSAPAPAGPSDGSAAAASEGDDGDSDAPLVLSIIAVVLAAGALALSAVRRKQS